MNYKISLKLAFISVASLLFSSVANAIELGNPIEATQKICPSAKLLPQRIFDTTKYYVYICRGEKANSLGYYVRIPKTGGGNITLPVSRKTGETYIAVKGELTYIVNPYELIVSKHNRIILRERVNNARSADGKLLTRGCDENQNTFGEAETKSFILYICGGDIPANYIAIPKNSETLRYQRISLPLQNYNPNSAPKATEYIAVNGDTRYVLTRNLLKVSHHGEIIFKEKVLHWN